MANLKIPCSLLNKKLLSNEQGSVLIAALAVLFVLSTILLFAVTYTLTRYSVHVARLNTETAQFLSDAGVARVINELDLGNNWPVIEFASPNGGQVTASVSAWGPYYLVISNGNFANKRVRTTAIIGTKPDSLFSAAITVSDKRLPLVVSGNTRIKGDINCGPLGLQTGSIGGESVTTRDFHIGEVNQSSLLRAPTLDTTLLHHYSRSLEQRKIHANSIISGSFEWDNKSPLLEDHVISVIVENNLRIDGAMFNGFDTLRSIFVNGFVEITGETKLSGLLEIIAEGPIEISGQSIIDGIILKSNSKIKFRGQSKFSGTAISKSGLEITGEASTTFPATFLLYTDSEAKLLLSSSKLVEGTAIVATSNQSEKEQSQNSTLILDTAQVFKGYLLSSEQLELHGYLLGSIATRQFIYPNPPTTYVNWIKDAYIDREGLKYSGALPIMNHNQKTEHRVIQIDRSY